MDKLQKIKDFWSEPESYEYHESRSHVADIEWLIEQVEKLQSENERYKDVNQGLLEVQLELRNKEREYQQWFEAASKNVKSKDTLIEQLEKDVEFFKLRQENNKKVTQELVALKDIQVNEILTKTRIIGEPAQEGMSAKKFIKGLSNFSDTCSSCKFFNSTTNECREKKIVVSSKEPRCDKWRYFA